ncbi:Mitochondrial outer membrane protein iml2 [Fusarium irregulare]|uniref:Inclusion body clearance protein IML2 n=1 Tax=Fusarium irregulare TaxID=2494466 RepID=A0A9W8PI48_9HYPO|nr:Mitochondrial outer membrane protein iml2 [Fusarium irregulare]KAJ4013395.1 Mitochondrial outer membrane protein iml2 [Fusarium irregulare]
MSRLAGWFRSGTATPATEANSDAGSITTKDTMAREMEDIDDAMASCALIMNDDIDGAWERLQTGDSSFHQLGLAVTIFMRSVLGFEKTVMTETTAKLDECEAKAWAEFKKAQKHGKARAGSKLYPPGTEFELVRAQTQLMGAVVGVLHESLIDAMKSFLKLRKAFMTLDAIIEAETKTLGSMPQATSEASLSAKPVTDVTKSMEKLDIESGTQTPANVESSSEDEKVDEGAPLKEAKSKATESDNVLLENPLDIFVHSGASMCFGMILLMLTLVPPAFTRLLSVVGFRGDRERGVRMLWRSTAYANVNGAISGLILLSYYNALLGAVDILPSAEDFDEGAEVVGPPRAKCEKLLASMRARYPDSRLWLIEEARLYSNERNLPKAVEVLTTAGDAKMKQVTALNNFELSLNSMAIQDWPLMRDSFMRCLELNDWSHALYYYMAGIASIELYRDAVAAGDEDEARRQKTKAEELLRKAPGVAGKKRFMARQLPFEVFVQRKIQKWEERAKSLSVDLADAIGASPAAEMSYMWNTIKRMGPAELEKAVGGMSWDRCTAKPEVVEKIKAEVDEMGSWALITASLYRSQKKFEEAREMLETHVLKHERIVFKGPTKDDYVLAAGVYEMGAIAWSECCNPPEGTPEEIAAYRRQKYDECVKQLDVAKVWEAFVLDTRIGMRVQSGIETLNWFAKKMNYK